MSRFLNVLRSWLVMVSVIAAGNTLQSFRDHGFLSEKLYTASPGLVNGLQARTFGVWTLLSSVIRCLCAIDIRNRTLHLPHCSLDNWSYGTSHGSKFLYYGDADWAAVPGGRSTITKQEEKLKMRALYRSASSPVFTARLPLKLS
ncbi:ergosterol biosynthetic protein 28 homolog isoform X2 [Pipra filicauda]|uniref:Ergosterol biosynthetic protein 28 homolog isoform X2 n=1 Tax=Pipra filicauda TaxID=649802 RepID=A0A6J2GKX6_9PASS|nr:ergosterol biosynthetic protein 28 homolog isoform X2 [Pipra filicauda]